MNNELQISDTGRIISIDWGVKRVGIAVCDISQMLARPEKVITRGGDKKLRSEIVRLIEEFDAVAVVIGLPLNFDGTESISSQAARDFVEFLKRRVTIPIVFQDERLTSREARERLRERGCKPNEIDQRVDMEAAAIILEDFLSVREIVRRQTKTDDISSEYENNIFNDSHKQF